MSAVVTTGAILFTDMVSSTELRLRLGEQRGEQLRKHHDDLMATAVAQHGGTVLRWTGDGIKAAFPNASNAAAAAVAIQRAVGEYGRSDSAVAVFQVRIGLAAGEVTIDDGDHHGVAVIEAARLEAMARPGEILATDIVRVLSPRNEQIAFEPLGDRTLKGLDQAIAVQRVVDLSAASIPPLPRTLRVVSPHPTVGREGDVESIVTNFAAVRAGVAAFSLIRGGPGIGKTRLVAASAAALHDAGALVLAGRCPPEDGVAYQPVLEALVGAVGLDQDLDQAMRDGTGVLARLFPGDDTEVGNADASALPAAARLELFDAVTEVFRRLARLHPLVLVLDDLHLASESTLLLIDHLLSTLIDERMMTIATLDGGIGDSATGDDPLTAFLRSELPRPRTSTITLAPLAEGDVAALIAAADSSLSWGRVAELAQRVHRESGGTPDFAVALIEHLQHDSSSNALPSTVAEVAEHRLARFAPTLRDLLALAAVAGDPFNLATLAQAERDDGRGDP